MKKIFFVLFILGISSCTSVVFQPSQRLYYSPERTLRIKPEDFSISVEKGISLHAWKFSSKQQPAKAVVVQFHGNAENISSHYLSVAWMLNYGYDVFSFDYRGYGLSSGSPKFKVVVQDSEKILNFVGELYKDHHIPMIVYGQSLGSLIASNAVKNSNVHIDQMILEGGIYSLNQVSSNVLSKHWLTWLFQPLGHILMSSRYNFKKISKDFPNIPVLLLHSKMDPIISHSQSEKIFKTLQTPKCLMLVDEPSHVNIGNLESGKYRPRILNFLEKHECEK